MATAKKGRGRGEGLVTRGDWEITLRNLRAMKKEIAKLVTQLRRLEERERKKR